MFPDGATVSLKGFGEYVDQTYVVRARALGVGTYRLEAQSLEADGALATKDLKGRAFARTLKAPHLAEVQAAAGCGGAEESRGEHGGRVHFGAEGLL